MDAEASPVAESYSRRAHVGARVALTVLWTIALIAGITVGILVLLPNLGAALQGILTSTIEATGIALAVSVALILVGLWGVSSSYRNLRHSVDLIAEVDRARKETIQLEGTRFLQPPK